ncbi:MAG: class I SAM-dependent DNA methyltransferase [Stomatobaculum sp.]
MEAYTSFARVYDLFMDNVPYDEWCGQLLQIFREHGIEGGIVADLGCGTGNLTERLAAKGYDMIGIDNSGDMLELALEKRLKTGHNILYLCQDMRSFELYGTCRAIVSRCDAINYLLSRDALLSVFRLVNNYLDPEGIFVFDCNTLRKYETVLADNTIAENREIGSFIWENSYDPESRINEYDLTLYIRDDGSAAQGEPKFRRFTETHFQRAYTVEELKSAAAAAGLLWLDCVDADTMGMPDTGTERLLITLGEHGKRKENS